MSQKSRELKKQRRLEKQLRKLTAAERAKMVRLVRDYGWKPEGVALAFCVAPAAVEVVLR